jgi:hypothetical protein
MRGVDAARAWCVRNRAPLLLALALLLLNLAVRAIARALDPDGQEALAPGVVTLGLTALLAAGVALVRLRAGRALAREAAGSAFAAALAAAGIVLFGGYVSGGGLQGGVWLTVGRWLITWVFSLSGPVWG